MARVRFKTMTCGICNRKFRNPRNLQKHTLEHMEKLKCHECGSSFLRYLLARDTRPARAALDGVGMSGGVTSSNKDLPLHSEAGSSELSATLTNRTDSMWQDYQKREPTFVPPSAQACQRYRQSFHLHTDSALIHPTMELTSMDFALRTAMFALGALHLLEYKNARALFAASKSVALDVWAIGSLKGFSWQLTSAFLLLLDFITIKLPANTMDELRRFHYALQLCLNTNDKNVKSSLLNSKSQWMIEEMNRRSQTFAACALSIQSYAFGYSKFAWPIEDPFRLPCSAESWETLQHTHLERDNTSRPLQGEKVTFFVNRIMNEKDNGYAWFRNLDILQALVVLGYVFHHLSVTDDVKVLFNEHVDIYEEEDRYSEVLDRMKSPPIENTNRFQRQQQDTASLLHLDRIRCYFTPAGIYGTQEAEEMLACFLKWRDSFVNLLSYDHVLIDMNVMVNLLQEPANTCFAFFVRYRANTWTLWNVISIFESALYLSIWIQDTAVKRSDDEACQDILNRLREILSMAWSSLDDSDGQPDFTDTKVLTKSVLLYWAAFWNL